VKYLIAGLGNIGDEYANTRHNIGFVILDAFAQAQKIPFTTARYGDIATTSIKGRSFIMLKPSTYMNLSGKAVKYWMDKENIPVENLLVICDDIALPLGCTRMKKKGGDAGHNGMDNIIFHLETTEFPRLRFGIGNDFARGHQVDFVLGKWTKAEEDIIIPRITTSVEMIKSFALAGIERTMTAYNSKG